MKCKNNLKPFRTEKVDVMVLEISWVSKNLTDFYKHIKDKGEDGDLLTNKMLKMLLESQFHSS